MPVPDNDQQIRDLAYFLWEKAGRPQGMEHRFWAEAQEQIEGQNDNRGTFERSVAR